MKNQHTLEKFVAFFLIVGGLNWGFIGVFNLDVIGTVFGPMSGLTRIIYVLAGLSAVYRVLMWLKRSSK